MRVDELATILVNEVPTMTLQTAKEMARMLQEPTQSRLFKFAALTGMGLGPEKASVLARRLDQERSKRALLDPVVADEINSLVMYAAAADSQVKYLKERLKVAKEALNEISKDPIWAEVAGKGMGK